MDKTVLGEQQTSPAATCPVVEFVEPVETGDSLVTCGVEPVEEPIQTNCKLSQQESLQVQITFEAVDREGRRIFRRNQQDIESTAQRSCWGILAICRTTHHESRQTIYIKTVNYTELVQTSKQRAHWLLDQREK